jgi:glycosyltransferase involved in cell wall biosynthesis
MEKNSLVCGFFGARDGYEIPVALQEAGLLSILLTDYYGEVPWLKKLGLVRAERYHPKLDPRKVCGSAWLTFAKKISERLFADPELQNHLPDLWLSAQIGKTAAREKAHIFTYEPYAVPRPEGGFSHCRKQILFHCHPHVECEDRIFTEDQKKYPEFYHGSKVNESPYRRRTADAWRQADLILCASSFTRDSLVAAGMPGGRCRVIPYGTRPRFEDIEVKRDGPLKLLFVGRNPLRKGLHHLLLGWREAKKKTGDRLTVVSLAPERPLQELATEQDDVVWKDSVSGEELGRLYQEADALVVPSLSEGFGHVYLEAMGYGCAVVGTGNSALPDLGGEEEGVFQTVAGESGPLAELISKVSVAPGIFRSRSEAARQRSRKFTWEKFRAGIREAVVSFLEE